MRFREHVSARLEDLRLRGLLRAPVTSDVPTGTHVVVEGRRLLNLCSNNYLGLADDPRLRDALAAAATRWGSAGASRLVTGSLAPHLEAEASLARYVQLAASRLFPSGYAANVGAVSGLVGPGDVVFSDALNHASLIDGCRLSRARVIVFPHRDVDALAELLAAHRHAHRAALIVTDAIFSMDGDVAPLAALRSLADRFEAGLLVDEAHSLGVLGPEGRGLCAELAVQPDVLTGMLGKAFGLGGGFIAAEADTLDLLQSTARSYVFSTGIHAALAAVVPRVVGWVAEADDARARLRRHRATLAQAVPDELLGASDARPDARVPVLPVVLGEGARALAVSAALRERGVFGQAIRPPTVAHGTARLRLVPIATHTPDDIARAAEALGDILRRAEPSAARRGDDHGGER
ncbi:MAG: 8-amino-7-oxononanoate synthase [Sandaracinus sp.]